MSAPAIAIDFGTTRTKVAYFDVDRNEARLLEIGREIRTIIPSTFYVPRDGQGTRLVGDDAQEQVEIDPEGIVLGLKRDIHRLGKIRCGPGRPSVERIELASDLFAYIRDQCREVFPGKTVTQCTLTIPVAFEAQKRECIRKAAQRAGFQQIRLLEEPIAAAQAWLAGTGQKIDSHVVVCDVGGGTTDFALLRYERGHFEEVPDVPTTGFGLGGNDVDEAIWTHLLDTSPGNEEAITKCKNGFLVKLRRIKEMLSRQPRAEVPITSEGTKLIVPRAVVTDSAREFIERVVDEMKRFLTCCSAAGVKDCPVLLVGGGSRLAGLREAIEVLAPARVFQWNQSDYATVLGAVDRPALGPRDERKQAVERAVENPQAQEAPQQVYQPAPDHPVSAGNPQTTVSNDEQRQLIAGIIAGAIEAKKERPAFRFRSGSEARTLDELVALCESHREDAEWHLMEGHFEPWLQAHGHTVQMAIAVNARKLSNPRTALVAWLRYCGPEGIRTAHRMEFKTELPSTLNTRPYARENASGVSPSKVPDPAEVGGGWGCVIGFVIGVVFGAFNGGWGGAFAGMFFGPLVGGFAGWGIGWLVKQANAGQQS